MSKIQTTEDGWECVPELKHACRIIDSTNDMTYEIKKCVRNSGLESLVNNMTAALEHAIDILNEIDISNQYITVDEEDEEEPEVDEDGTPDLYQMFKGPLS